MNKNELKQVLKPLIKECIREVIFEEGTLSTIISEVVQGVGQPIVETKQRFPKKQQSILPILYGTTYLIENLKNYENKHTIK